MDSSRQICLASLISLGPYCLSCGPLRHIENREVAQLPEAVLGEGEPDQANEIITSGAGDLVFLARETLREPYWPLKTQQALNQDPSWPLQYGYAVRMRLK